MSTASHDRHHEVIGGTLAQGAGEAPDTSAIAEATLNTWWQVVDRLAPVIGAGGVDALFSRSLHVTSKTFPWLAMAGNDGNGAALLAGLKMNVRAVVRHSIHQALHHALEQSQFLLHYQPKVNLETGAMTGVEALVRLRQADHRLVGPTEFMSIAENSGLILPIGRWVLREACRQTAAWLQAGLDIGSIAVNVSMVEFRDKDFLAGVRAILNDTGLNPRHLELELTESGVMQDTETTTAILRALKDLGVRLAIDDFGTGYSSLSYLRRFPIDTLKIDQSFVRDIDGDTGEAVLVSAIIALGQSLKLGVVAEGIETEPQLAFLKSRHCAEGQGYYFSRPMAAEDFATLLATGPH